jgi:NADH-quinone oxidoreductase subunit A
MLGGNGGRERSRVHMMDFDFAMVLGFLLVSVTFIGLTLVAGRFVRPRLPDAEKSSTYECGERPIGSAWFNFNPRFYVMALVFLVFDVEIALTFPAAVVVRSWVAQGRGALAVVEIGSFLAVLLIALVYVWGKGDLDWMRDSAAQGDDR